MSSRRGSRRPSQQQSGEMLLECKAAYLSIFDTLQDTIDSRSDFVTVLQQTGRNPTTKVVNKYWKHDTESLSFDQFCDVCKNEEPTTTDDLMKAFRRIDLNNDGYLSLHELHKMMTTKGEMMSLAEVKELLDECDENKDGRLDYGEFCKMVMSTSEDCKKMSRKMMDRKERHKKRALLAKQTSPSAVEVETKPEIHGNGDSDILSERGSLVSLNSSHSRGDMPKAAPRRHDSKSKSPVSKVRTGKDKSSTSYEEWSDHVKMKGCFFVEDDNTITNHWYTLKVPTASTVHITIQSIKLPSNSDDKVDTSLFVLKSRDGQTVGCTDAVDSKGRSHTNLELSSGIYTLAPFTSGVTLHCRKRAPKNEITLVRKDRSSDQYTLTRQFRTALEEIFDLCDLDDNGCLSREEFNQFNIRTSGESVADEEWKVVEENVELKGGEITKGGFVRLNEMEVEDNEGDTEDSWLTLSNMGYNKALVLDEACPFLIDVYADGCEGLSLKVKGLESATNDRLNTALVNTAISKGVCSRVKGARDVTLYNYKTDAWGYIVADNKSSSEVKLKLDCHSSKNCVSTLTGMVGTVDIPAASNKVVARFVPERDAHDWTIVCSEHVG